MPQQNDIIVQGNPDLNNKVIRIPVGHWENSDLQEIARLGFKTLKFDIVPDLCRQLATESCFSPQLMQQLCYDFCKIHDISESNERFIPFIPDMTLLPTALSRTAQSVHYNGVIDRMLEGRLERRGKKTRFHIFDEIYGDFYFIAALIIAVNPPRTDFSRVEIQSRMRRIYDLGLPNHSRRPGIQKLESAFKFFSECDQKWTLNMILARLVDPDDKKRAGALEEFFNEYAAYSLIEQSADTRGVTILDPSFLFQLRNTPSLRRIVERLL